MPKSGGVRAAGEGEGTQDNTGNNNEEVKNLLNEKFSSFGSEIKKVSDKVSELETKVTAPVKNDDDDDDFGGEEDRPLTKKETERLLESREKKRDAETAYKESFNHYRNKAREEFPEMKDDNSVLFKEAGKIYDSLPKHLQAAEDVVYNCAVKAKLKLKETEEKKNLSDKGRKDGIRKTGGGGGGKGEDDNTDHTQNMSERQRGFVKRYNIDPKKYAERRKEFDDK